MSGGRIALAGVTDRTRVLKAGATRHDGHARTKCGQGNQKSRT